METEPRKIPEVLYAPDGTKYYPCLYCCRAFAHKRYASLHMKGCVKIYFDQTEESKGTTQQEFKSEPPEEPPETIDLSDDSMESLPSPSPKTKSKKHKPTNSCKLCDEIFGSMDELVMHAKIEHNQRGNGEKRTFPPEDLEYFYAVFIKSKKSMCPICDKPIGNKLNWKRHLYTHSSIKKYECKVCKKTFTRSDHCKYHEQRHSLKAQKQYYGQYL